MPCTIPQFQCFTLPCELRVQARAERKAAADAYLSAVTAAAARQDINALLQQLSKAAATPAADTPPAPTYKSELEAAVATAGLPSQQQQQQQMQWLLPAALTLAARQLATAPGGKPQFAQALVELVLDQGIIEPPRAQRAVHAVLQAYYDAGDYTGVSVRGNLDCSLSSCDKAGMKPAVTWHRKESHR